MKLLCLTPEYPPGFGGGIGSFYAGLVPALEEAGCDVSILRGSAFFQSNESGKSVLLKESMERWLNRFSHLTLFPLLRRHLAAAFALHEQADAGDGYDVIEATDWGLLYLPWLLSSAIPVVVQLHGSCGQISRHEPITGQEAETLLYMLLEDSTLSAAGCLCTPGKPNATYWEKLLQRKVEQQLPAVPMLKSKGGAVGNEWLTAGRIQNWKGPEVAARAWSQLGADAPTLRWFGRDTLDGASGKSLDGLLRARHPKVWGSKITPEEPVNAARLLEKMRTAKAVLVPSLWDVFNLVAAEAMALGKAIVISDGAGAAELVRDGMNGFVFRSGDAEALAAKVREVEKLGDNELTRIGQNAARTIAEKLDPAAIARQRMELYQNAARPIATPALEELRKVLLSPGQSTHPLRFLDALPLKELTRYVARRGLDKAVGHAP